MNKWTTQLDEIGIDLLLHKGIEILLIIREKETNLDILDDVYRIERVYKMALTVLGKVDPFITPFTVLSEISSHLTQINSDIENFISNRNVAYLNNANSRVEAVLKLLSTLIYPNSSQDIDGVREATSSYHKSIGQLIRYTKEQHEAKSNEINVLQTKIKELVSIVDQQESRLDNFITSTQEQFNRVKKIVG